MSPASHVALIVLAFLSWSIALGWLWQAASALRGMPTLPDLTRLDPDALPPIPAATGPLLAVIVPACNEENSIATTLRSLLASTGIRLEIVAVDDRSTDATGARMDELAEEAASGPGPHRLEVLHIRELPPGWLGKPHALVLGERRSHAPWLLFTDGDVVFEPQTLALALRQALAAGADHLVLTPTVVLKTTGEAAMLGAMQALAQWSVRLWKVADPRARDFMGVGGFNLIRREAYLRVGGFEGLRMEVLEDLRLGWRVKRAGLAQRVAVGPGLARIRWIDGPFAVVRLMEKNGFALYSYRVGLTLLASLGLAAQAIVPLASLVPLAALSVAGVGSAAALWAAAGSLVAHAALALLYRANRRITMASPWLALFFTPATAIVLYAFVRSMVLALVRGGVDWRGTRYPLDELRRNARHW